MPRCSRRLIALVALSVLGALLWPTARAGEQERADDRDDRRVGQIPQEPGPRRRPRDLLRRLASSRRATPTACGSPGDRRRASPWSRARTASTGPARSSSSDPTTRPTGRTTSTARSSSSDGDAYRMWYTGQARGKSWIGYATSQDGKTWRRESDRPVLSAEGPWEKVAVMCPHVLYDERGRALPDVVLGRRAVRAGRHRLCDQQGRPDVGEARATTRSSGPTRPRPGRRTG